MPIENLNPYESPKGGSRPEKVPARVILVSSRELVILVLQFAGVVTYGFFLYWLLLGPPTDYFGRLLPVANRRNQFFYTEALTPWLISLLYCLATFGLLSCEHSKVARRITFGLMFVVALPFLAIVGIRGFDAVELLFKRK